MRQHISLSEYAYNVINCDLISYKKTDNLSAFISLILENYYNSPDVSILTAYREQKLRIRSCYEKFDSDYEENLPEEADYYFITKVLLGYVEYRIKNEIWYPNEVTIKPYIKNGISEKIDDQLTEETCMFSDKSDYSILGFPKSLNSKAAYIKNILEHYARLSPYKRDAIIYKKLFNTIKKIEQVYSVANDLKSVRLNLYRVEVLQYDGSNGCNEIQETLFKPYRFTKEHETEWPYLLGYACVQTSDTTRTYVPKVLSIADIYSIKECAHYMGSGKLTAEQMAELDKQTKRYGLISLDSETVEILFTKTGLHWYLNASSPKPYTNPTHMLPCSDGRFILKFKGNARSIEQYFSHYGDYAIILSPADANETMRELYEESAEGYAELSSSQKMIEDPLVIKEISERILKMKKNPKLFYTYSKEYKERNRKQDEHGIYGRFIKTVAEAGFKDVYALYADMLFEGLLIQKDYKLAAKYYAVSPKITKAQEYNLASIYENGICGKEFIRKGKDILSARSLTEDKLFDYKTPEGYIFHAPETRYQDIFGLIEE